jgi:hypothetical protein
MDVTLTSSAAEAGGTKRTVCGNECTSSGSAKATNGKVCVKVMEATIASSSGEAGGASRTVCGKDVRPKILIPKYEGAGKPERRGKIEARTTGKAESKRRA